MQRFILLTCLTAFVVTSPAFAQQMEDVVHLKNGGLIRGTIIEEVVGESLKIKTRDGNVFVYTMDEIAKMSREPVMGMRHIGIQEKNPVVSCILSLVIPGAGQFYNGEPLKGIAHLGMVIGGWASYIYNTELVYKDEGFYGRLDHRNEGLALLGVLTVAGAYVWSAIDAPISASRINRQSQQPSYGHLIELGGSRATLGVDPVVSQRNLGTRLTLHF